MEQPIGACILLFNPQGKLLIGKRKNGYKSGYFGIPGGRLEVGEKMMKCAKRELEEETGLTLDRLKFVGFIKENQTVKDFIHFVFLVERVIEKPICCEPDKCEGWDWYSLKELPEPLLPGHAAALKLYLLKKNFLEI